jgi:hypothetical protein
MDRDGKKQYLKALKAYRICNIPECGHQNGFEDS